MPRLSDLVQRRSFGFAGAEGEAFDEADYQNRLAALTNPPRMITNKSLAMDVPSNYIQRTGGQRINLGQGQVAKSGYQGVNLEQQLADLTRRAAISRSMDDPAYKERAARDFLRLNPEMANEPGFSYEELAGRPASGMTGYLGAEIENTKRAMEQQAAQEQQRAAMMEKPADRLAREKFEWEKAQGKPKDTAQVERVQTANDALGIIKQAKDIFDKGAATESMLGAATDWTGRVFGLSTEGAKDAARLKALEGALVAKMPKMSGPQSDKDVKLYRDMAGQIADDTVPIAIRRAALATVEELQKKYAGIENGTPDMPKGGTVQDGYLFLGGDPADPARWRKM